MERKSLKRKPLRATNSLKSQLKRHSKSKVEEKSYEAYSGNTETMISTGSTLLDLAISGGRKRGGGIPGGILIEAFGPNGSGKTVFLCEVGGAIQRQGGDNLFNDPEARLNKKFAGLFDLKVDELVIENPDTVTEVIKGIQKFEPKHPDKINGILTDSLAALSTEMEMEKEEGDKMGGRRAKELSEGLRKVCRLLKNKNYIMACSNQIRDKMNTMGYGEQFTVPGGYAVGFYASLRLRFFQPEKLIKKKSVHGKDVKHVYGTKVKVEVYKNSVDAPYRTAEVFIVFDYGIDNIRANLQYLKDFSSKSVYHLNGRTLDKSLEASIAIIEEERLEKELEEAVIDKWEEIQNKFKVERVAKRRK